MKKTFILLLTVLFIATACSNSENSDESGEGEFDNYPNEDIDFLVGFDAGGGSDTITRTIGKFLNEEDIVDQDFVVENMPGAGGGLALMELKKRSDDPYTLLSMPDTGDPVWQGTIDADIDDFKLLAQLASDSIVILVNEKSSYKDLDDLIKAMKENPSNIDIGLGADVYSEEGQTWYEIGKEHDIDFNEMNFIPQDGGSAIENSLLGEHIDVAAINLSSIYGQIEAGEFRPLAVLSSERSENLPDVPTLVEEGVDHSYERIRGVWTGKDVPNDIVTYWEDRFEELVNTDLWQDDYIKKNMLESNFKRSKEYEADLKKSAESLLDFKKDQKK